MAQSDRIEHDLPFFRERDSSCAYCAHVDRICRVFLESDSPDLFAACGGFAARTAAGETAGDARTRTRARAVLLAGIHDGIFFRCHPCGGDYHGIAERGIALPL